MEKTALGAADECCVGPNGANGKGLIGATGLTGAIGATGSRGFTGATGATGAVSANFADIYLTADTGIPVDVAPGDSIPFDVNRVIVGGITHTPNSSVINIPDTGATTYYSITYSAFSRDQNTDLIVLALILDGNVVDGAYAEDLATTGAITGSVKAEFTGIIPVSPGTHTFEVRNITLQTLHLVAQGNTGPAASFTITQINP